ncbi:hypothetical protein Ciccas_000855 [Cichlidogyrus casuarinus]|uniref:Uncharacterized protein n=1 Tax=Cichlidogyrus casuarinus TaxID=1844966 RepID=A0ABD2QM62_9PLAT
MKKLGWLPFFRFCANESAFAQYWSSRVCNLVYVAIILLLIVTGFVCDVLVDHVTPGRSITRCMLFDLLCLLIYLMGMRHFRYSQSEAVIGLLERVFQYASFVPGREAQANRMIIRRIMCWFIAIILWIGISLALKLLFVWQNDEKNPVLLVLLLLGFCLLEIITMAVIFIYLMQCELVKTYTELLCQRIQLRAVPISVIFGVGIKFS